MRQTIASWIALCAACTGCGSGSAIRGIDDAGWWPGSAGDLGAAGGNGNFGNVGVGGGQDFAAFRDALDHGMIPAPSTLDATGFFAEHYTSLPPPTCTQTFCLHGMLSVTNDLVRGGDWTLLQMGMNSTIDPSTVTRPPLDVAVVLDRSGSMADSDKEAYAIQGIDLLIDALGPSDTLTFIAFDDEIDQLYGPATVTDKTAVKAIVDAVGPRGSTDIYAGLEAGYQAVLSVGDETQQRRVIFLTDGLPTTGVTDPAAIESMSAGYNEQYAGLTMIGLGTDVDAGFLRDLSEQGGGNFYFIANPQDVTDVFTDELAYFVAPLAYDVDLTFDEQPYFTVKEVYGTSLWKTTTTGGAVHVPSVFLVSRTSSMPNLGSGGRRGGGAAIIAELSTAAAPATTGSYDVAALHLGYRLPGSSTRLTQDVTVSFDGVPGQAPAGGYFTDDAIAKNTLIMDFFIAFRDATALAQTDEAGALKLLTDFQPRITQALAGNTDSDLADDLAVLQEYIGVLSN